MRKSLSRRSRRNESKSSDLLSKVDKIDWSKKYSKLSQYSSQLKVPSEDDSLYAYDAAINKAIELERDVTRYYIKAGELSAETKRQLILARTDYKLKLKALLADEDFELPGRTRQERELFLSAYLVDEQKEIDRCEDRHIKLDTFLQCVNKLLQNITHYRQDIGRKIKVLCVKREIGEHSS